MNNKYLIRVEHPLLRPGLSIETEASERYVEKVTLKLMEIAREINIVEDEYHKGGEVSGKRG